MRQHLQELYRYRALLGALVLRHLAVRYRGSVLGFLWSFLNPLCLMLVYLLVFRFYIRFDQVENYTLFLFCGLLPWVWSTSALTEGTSSIVSSGHLITKSMFPAHLLPTVAVTTSFINYLLSLPILLLLMLIMGAPLHLSMLALPLVCLLQFLFLLGLSLALGALNVRFRDVQHIVANLLTFLFFLCPIVYPSQAVPERFRFTLELNPIAQLTMFYHQIILDGALPSLHSLIYVLAWTGVVVCLGVIIFDRQREQFAENL